MKERSYNKYNPYNCDERDYKRSIKHYERLWKSTVGKINVKKISDYISGHTFQFLSIGRESPVFMIKEVYRRRNTIRKNSYCKSLIILFIWLIAFSTCSQLFLCGNPLA